LGDWLFGSQSANISEIIARQGTAGATVVLASFNPLGTSIDILDYSVYNSENFGGFWYWVALENILNGSRRLQFRKRSCNRTQ